MIKLIIEPYCQNCPEFEAKKDLMQAETFYGGIDYHTYICCEHIDRCESIVKYLKGEINHEEKANKVDSIVPCDICNHGRWDDCDSSSSCPVRNQDSSSSAKEE